MAWMRISRCPVSGFLIFGMFKLSSEAICQSSEAIIGIASIRTVSSIRGLYIYVEIHITLESLSQKLDLLITLDTAPFGVCPALAITFILIESNHFFYASFVLLLDAQLKF
jgi:hypothetical protein